MHRDATLTLLKRMDEDCDQEAKLGLWRSMPRERLVEMLGTHGKRVTARVRYTLMYTLSRNNIDDFIHFFILLPRHQLAPFMLETYAKHAFTCVKQTADCIRVLDALKNQGWEGYKETKWLFRVMEGNKHAYFDWLVQAGGAGSIHSRNVEEIRIYQGPYYGMGAITPYRSAGHTTRVLDLAIFSGDISFLFIRKLLRIGARFGELTQETNLCMYSWGVRNKYEYARRVLRRRCLLPLCACKKTCPLPQELMREVATML